MALDQINGSVRFSSGNQGGERYSEQIRVEREQPSGLVSILRTESAEQRAIQIRSKLPGRGIPRLDGPAELARLSGDGGSIGKIVQR